jgi:hypothetical protein
MLPDVKKKKRFIPHLPLPASMQSIIPLNGNSNPPMGNQFAKCRSLPDTFATSNLFH